MSTSRFCGGCGRYEERCHCRYPMYEGPDSRDARIRELERQLGEARGWVRELIDRHLDDSDTSTGVWHVFDKRLKDAAIEAGSKP